jgi:hypothetical protein
MTVSAKVDAGATKVRGFRFSTCSVMRLPSRSIERMQAPKR